MPDNVRRAIAAEVRAALARHEKTQRQVADLLGMSQPAASLRLTGQRSFRAEEIAAISVWLNEPVGALIPAERKRVAA